MLDVDSPRRSRAVNLGWLLLVPGLGLTEASCCLFVHTEKQLGWACKLGGAESLEISKACLTVLGCGSLRCGTSLPGLWGKGLGKGQCPLLTLMPDTPVSPSMPLVPFKLPPRCWSSEGMSLSR